MHLVRCGEGMSSRGTVIGLGGQGGKCEHHEVQQIQVQGLAPGLEKSSINTEWGMDRLKVDLLRRIGDTGG